MVRGMDIENAIVEIELLERLFSLLETRPLQLSALQCKLQGTSQRFASLIEQRR
jgi:hypothetical protein